MTFTEACAAVFPDGQYKGKTVGDVGVTAEGLQYLDWRTGIASTPRDLAHAIDVYLADETIRAELDELTGWKG